MFLGLCLSILLLILSGLGDCLCVRPFRNDHRLIEHSLTDPSLVNHILSGAYRNSVVFTGPLPLHVT